MGFLYYCAAFSALMPLCDTIPLSLSISLFLHPLDDFSLSLLLLSRACALQMNTEIIVNQRLLFSCHWSARRSFHSLNNFEQLPLLLAWHEVQAY